MQELIASVDHITFDLELAVEQQLGAQPLPFPGMDSACGLSPARGARAGAVGPRRMGWAGLGCPGGGMCPFRHISGEKTVVCKHWLRGLCKKGDQCEFLHEYDMTKMPECYFYSKFGECSNKECPFLHIDPESKIKDCPWYDRGFCKHGPLCRHRHTRRVICVNYLVGFCPEGPASLGLNCQWEPQSNHHCLSQHKHSKSWQSTHTQIWRKIDHLTYGCSFPFLTKQKPQGSLSLMHLTSQNSSTQQRTPQVIGVMQSQNNNSGNRGPRPLEQVTCYKCGEKGHYANRCTKGHLAFLSGQDPNAF
ncbi:hypothetical protein DV515_00007813 [Chloebia gouldiae]|uniref:Cleavage and polyadenylation specificity factor subunit 4 n=1 Tax=Chloebia gouldiae TaxID=44316 RepID=A0A3L8SG94_CHLGU|nr:hypothetical protein DV515_00007813 [Chloebia gouldiae]